MKCYRVWFEDGTARLIDAKNEHDARVQSLALVISQGYQGARIVKIECLS